MPHSPSVPTFQASNPPMIKHPTAIFLHLTGRITTNRTHLQTTSAPPELMRDCVRRLGA
jgi:hypothetical protein